MVTCFPHVTPPLRYPEDFEKALFCSFADFAHGLHHEIPGLCGHHAAELNHSAGKDYLRAGRKGWKDGGGGWEAKEGGSGGRKLQISSICRYVW